MIKSIIIKWAISELSSIHPQADGLFLGIGTLMEQVIIFVGFVRIKGRATKHAPPLGEVDEINWEGTDEHHNAHERNACLRREFRACKQQELRHHCPYCPSTSCHPWYHSQWPAKAKPHFVLSGFTTISN